MQLLLSAFESVPDPRAENTRDDLVEILVIAFVAVLCCCEMASSPARSSGVSLSLPWRPRAAARWKPRSV